MTITSSIVVVAFPSMLLYRFLVAQAMSSPNGRRSSIITLLWPSDKLQPPVERFLCAHVAAWCLSAIAFPPTSAG